MKKVFILGVVCIVAWGCSGIMPQPPQVNPDLQDTFTINADFNKTWTAIIETFAELNFPILNMDKASGLIATDWMTVDASHYECGSPGLTTAERGYHGKFNVFLKKTADGLSEIRVNCLYEMIIYYTNGLRKYPCVSTGKLESDMFELIKSKVR